MAKKGDRGGDRVLIDNRRVRHEYELVETLEAGMSLLGSEVKSLRLGNANLGEAYVRLQPEGATLVGCYVAPYAEANRQNHEPVRPRRLLLHRHQLTKLERAVKQRGMTVVPVKMYLKNRRIKLEIALARGKRSHDKRHDLKAKDAQREMSRQR